MFPQWSDMVFHPCAVIIDWFYCVVYGTSFCLHLGINDVVFIDKTNDAFVITRGLDPVVD